MKQAVFGKSVRGAAHIRSGTECQDSFRITLRGDGMAVLAASDGHGSKKSPYSRLGSRIAAGVFCSEIGRAHV